MENKPINKEKPEFKHIVRIASTDIDGNKSLGMALRKIRGINFMFSNAVCKIADVSSLKKTGELTDAEIQKIEKVVSNPVELNAPVWLLNRRIDYETGTDQHLLGPDIKFVQDNDLKRLKKIKSNRGLRHSAGLPVRGQRTRSNFRKNKGKVQGVKRKKGKGGRV